MEKIVDLDWGSVTPELFNEEKKTVVHIFNHYLIGEENLSRAIRFALGRIEWFRNYVSLECSHEIVIDDRGQDIDDNVRGIIIENLSKQALKVSFVSKRR